MTDAEKNKILSLRLKNMPFKDIASQLSLPVGTVKAFCSRKQINPLTFQCLTCGQPLPPQSRLNKHFCSNKCYRRWWEINAAHPRTYYLLTCNYCGKPFTVASHASQKYCSRDCYLKSRKGGQSDGE